MPGQVLHFVRADTALARLPGLVDLNAYVQRRCAVRALIVEPPGDADAVQGMDPLEALGHFAALVGLKAADEVPFDGQRRKRGDLGAGLLHVIFAETGLSGLKCRFNGGYGLSFTYSQYLDFIRAPAGVAKRRLHTGANIFEASCDLGRTCREVFRFNTHL